ncbi:hypothetical protein KP509_36G033700 [Ceratopteris richardii]|uniref:Pentatricopeptide repeat-containing protein n=1 Tax=Ceratopteris richardii TaxID=49495 RepID=A0A8T2QBV5_CERRI|nr:hypothetical protein KP509_36G033700 [Ceratopteris richardii]
MVGLSPLQDFQHKSTKEKLFLDCTRNPRWVQGLLRKKDRQSPPSPWPLPMPENQITDSATVAHHLKPISSGEVSGLMTKDGNSKDEHLVNIQHMEANAPISNYFKSNYHTTEDECNFSAIEDSICILEKHSSSEPSVSTLAKIIDMCRKKKNKDYALRLLAYLKQSGLDHHEILGQDVVGMLVEVGCLSEAQVLFYTLIPRTSHGWNALIRGYINCGDPRQALTLFRNMRGEKELHLHGHTTVLMVKACIALKDVKVGRLIHIDAAKEGFLKNNPSVGNSLLDMYMKCGLLMEAQNLFDMLSSRNVITWTSLIAGYVQNNHGDAALKSFQSMQDSGVTPNAFTFSSVLKACASLKNFTIGMEVHAKMEQEGLLETSQIAGNALIDMYAKCGLVTNAQEVFDLMPTQDVVSWNALITGYTDHGYFKEAIACFERMQATDISPNGITFASCLKACANTQALEKGREIHLAVSKRQLLDDPVLGSSLVDMYVKCGVLHKAKEVFDALSIQDAIAWTSIIWGYVQHEYFQKALVCFRQMRAKGIMPDAVAYSCALKACANAGTTSIGVKLHEEIEARGMLKGELLGNAVVDMYTKFGMLKRACKAFVALPTHNVISWTALLTGYAQSGDIQKVSDIIEKMSIEGITPTPVTSLSILQACSNAGKIEMAFRFLESMSEEYFMIPTLEHYTCVIDLLGRIGQVNRAVELGFRLPVHPNVVMWLAVLGACQRWGHLKLANAIFKQVMTLDESVTSSYVCMSNIYVDAALLEEAVICESIHAATESIKGEAAVGSC